MSGSGFETGCKLTRRQFVGSATALTAASLSAGALPGLASAETPKKGGTLRFGVGHGSTTDSLDPATYENNFTIALDYMLHNHLTEVDADGNLVPELAESWEASDDAKQWVFRLRQGAEFHNGKTLDAEDVVASVNHHRGEDSKSAAKALLESIEEIKSDGPSTVVVTLSGGNADFPFLISDYHVPILPSKDGMADASSGLGAGGYALKDFDPGVRATVTRHPNYWKENRAHFDGIEMLAIIDVVARTNALATGEIDLMDRCDLKTVHLLERNSDISVKSIAGLQHYTFPMRTDTPPFDDNNVRLALKLAVDREELVQKILKGHGTVGNDHPISPANRFHSPNLPQRQYDPEKAQWHLQQAGLSSLTVPLSASEAAFGGAVDASVLYQERAAKAGITIDVVREPSDGYWANVWMSKPWCACYWSGRPTADSMFSIAYAADAAWNDTFWSHDRFNALLKTGRAELNDSKRREIYGEMQQILRDEGGVGVPMFANYVFAASTKLKHGKIAANWDVDGQKFSERWWFA